MNRLLEAIRVRPSTMDATDWALAAFAVAFATLVAIGAYAALPI